MTIFDNKYMVDEIMRNVSVDPNNTKAVINTRYNETGLFSVMAMTRNESKASTICRTFPNVPLGIQTLNIMLDPEKSSERIRKTKSAKDRYFKDFGQMNMMKSYDKLLELLWYTRLPCFDVKGVTSEVNDGLSFVKRCYWRGKMVDCSQIFVTRPTDRGMCCGFNFDNAEKVFKKTKFTDSITKLQYKDKHNSFGGRSAR